MGKRGESRNFGEESEEEKIKGRREKRRREKERDILMLIQGKKKR